MLREAYESTWGIHDHFNNIDRNLLSVAVSPLENLDQYSVKREWARRFRRSNVGSVYHISWLDFLNLPKPDAQMLIEEANADVEEKNAAVNTLLQNNKKPAP